MKKFTIILWLMLVTTTLLWYLSKTTLDDIMLSPIKSIAQITALLGAIGYFAAYIFSSRLPFLEQDLPLDKSYKIHRLLGTLAGSGIILHVSSLIANLLPAKAALTLYLLPSADFAYTVGVLAFYLIILTLLTTLYLKLPYHIWKVVHQITSYSIIFATLHLFFITSDISRYFPLRVWMLGIAFLAVCAWFYKEFLYKANASSHEYAVTKVDTLQEITVITLSAIRRPLALKPGQFAFFKFFNAKSKPSREAHPFTVVASNPSEITIAVKTLGDYTKSIHSLQVGDPVRVAGPHGSFGNEILESDRPGVWIAGGIGITPFFNLISYLNQSGLKKNVSLFYTTTEQDLLFHPRLQEIASQLGYSYHYTCSNKDGRLTPEQTLHDLSESPKSYNFFLCGPGGLLVSTFTALERAGVPSSHIFTEDFDFKALYI